MRVVGWGGEGGDVVGGEGRGREFVARGGGRRGGNSETEN